MNSIDDDKGDVMNSGLGVAERNLLLTGLRALPDTTPPREVWRRIERQAQAEGLFRRRGAPDWMKWLGGFAVAATVALAVLNLPQFGGRSAEEGPFPTEPAFMESASLRNLDALQVRSQLLERNLRALPPDKGIVRAGTAATISDLQDRIAAIDYALNDSGTQLSAQEAEVFWRERVRLMDSLVQVRYAQAQRSAF